MELTKPGLSLLFMASMSAFIKKLTTLPFARLYQPNLELATAYICSSLNLYGNFLFNSCRLLYTHVVVSSFICKYIWNHSLYLHLHGIKIQFWDYPRFRTVQTLLMMSKHHINIRSFSIVCPTYYDLSWLLVTNLFRPTVPSLLLKFTGLRCSQDLPG